MNLPTEPNPFEAPKTYSNAISRVDDDGVDDLASACAWLKVMGYMLAAIGLGMLCVGLCHLLGIAEVEQAEISLLSSLYFFASWLTFRTASLLNADFQRYYRRTFWLTVLLSILVLPYCTIPGILVVRRMSKHKHKQLIGFREESS